MTRNVVTPFSHSTSKHFGVLLAGCAIAITTGCNFGGGSGGSGGEEADPNIVELPITYVKRTLPVDEDDPTQIVPWDVLEPDAFNGGAVLYIRDRAAASALETDITSSVWPDGALYDVKDIDAHWSGERIVFAMRGPEDPDLDDDEQLKWDIWEYNRIDETLIRIISDETAAQEGNDVAPHYMPDGRIVFSSDRQKRSKAVLLDEGKQGFTAMHENRQNGEYAFNLHVIDDEGDPSTLEQITFNQSHDIHPTMIADGRILFLRWDRYGNNNLSLYTVNPDGSDLQFQYGYHSQNTGDNDSQAVFSQPRELLNGRILVNLRPRTDNRLGGDMVSIDIGNYTEADQPTAGGQEPLSVLDVVISGQNNPMPSPHGYFPSAYPFYDGTQRLLVSWNACQLEDPLDPGVVLTCSDDNLANPNLVEADPVTGLWIYDYGSETQRAVVAPEEGYLYTDVATFEERTAPSVILPVPIENPDWETANVGVMHIRSVYDIDGVDTAPGGIGAVSNPGNAAYLSRPARFLKIVKAVSEPDDDVYDFDNEAVGVAGGQRFKHILGYVPIEPDGSAKFLVPADVPFSISVHDANLGRISPRHENWLQVRIGEQRECTGCHTANSEVPHGRRDMEPTSVNLGAGPSGFPNAAAALFPVEGETMAETYARINGPRVPSFNIVYTDEWAGVGTTADPDITLKYRDADPDIGLNTTPPVSTGCENNWTSFCRGEINYLSHIQPLWDYLGRVNDADESAVCVDCHSRNIANPDATQFPIGTQLELTNDPIGPLNLNPNQNQLWVVSYLDLFRQDYQMELDMDDNLIRSTVTGVIGQDVDGNDILGPVPIQIQSPFQNGGFVSVFSPGGSHDGGVTRLTPHELKLISEWLDIGAQYYNDPFDAPLD
ncbi:hypothetical protein NBRC116494_30940 [Aurantivibrio plasticivorans]